MCYDVSDCNNKGYCIKNQCLCDVAWFGTDCTDNLEIFLPRGFKGYRATFITIYLLILFISAAKLYLKLKEEKYLFNGGTCMFLFKAFRSPFNLCMLSILIIAITRIIWLSIDPFGYEHILHRSLERLLFELTYSLLFLVYAVVLLVWNRIHEELSDDKPLTNQNRIVDDLNLTHKKDLEEAAANKKNDKDNKRGSIASRKILNTYTNNGYWVSNKIKLFVLLVFIAQITTSISKGFYNTHYRWFTLTVYVVLFFFLVIITIEYLIYGYLIHRVIQRQEEKIKQYEDTLNAQKAFKPAHGHLAHLIIQNGDLPKIEEAPRDSEANELHQPEQSDLQRSSLGGAPYTENSQLSSRIMKTEGKLIKSKPIEESQNNSKLQSNNEQSIESENEDNDKASRQEMLKAVGKGSHRNIFQMEEVNPKRGLANRHTIISTGLDIKTVPKLKRQGSIGKPSQMEKTQPKASKFREHRLREDLEKETKIKQLANSDISYARPEVIRENDIAEDFSVIIDDDYYLKWDPINIEEKKENLLYTIRQEKRKQENEKDFEKAKEELALSKALAKKVRPSQAEQKFNEYQQKLFEDKGFRDAYLEVTENDHKVMKKISTLTVIAIVLEIIFAVVSVIVFQTSLLQHPAAMIFSMWIIGLLEVASIFAIIILFSMVHSQKNENLQLVMRLGQSSNRINRLYQFKLPQYMIDNRKDTEEDRDLVEQKTDPNGKPIELHAKRSERSSKKLLQDNINKITSRYIKKISLIISKTSKPNKK